MNDPLQTAMELRRAGRLAEAARLYDDMLRAEPKHFEALHALGIIRYQTGQPEEAERLIGEAIEINPNAADALYNRACLLQRLNRPDEALVCFERALLLKPDYIEALVNMSAVLTALGRHADSLAALDKVLARVPGLAEAWNNRGSALASLDRHDEALISFDRALALKPTLVDALSNRGNSLIALQRHAEAAEVARYVVFLAPERAEAWRQVTHALAQLSVPRETLALCEGALRRHPGDAAIHCTKADTYLGLLRYEEAVSAYEELLKLDPDYPYAQGNLAIARLHCCDWRHVDHDRALLSDALRAGKHVMQPLYVAVLSDSPEEQWRSSRLWMEKECPPAPALWRGERYRHERIRVAYLSGDFRIHPVPQLLAGIIEHHDRARFETVGISFGVDDGSVPRARMKQAFERFTDMRMTDNAGIAAKLREQEIDIAVDLMGYTHGAHPQILAARPAPVQVNWLGFPSTMAADYMDYVIADHVVLPENEQRWHSEKPVYLPGTYLPTDAARDIAEHVPTRGEASLPEEGFVFCCFNSAHKILPGMFALWMRLLGAVPGSVLWLLRTNETCMRNLRSTAEGYGIAAERIVFAIYAPSDAEHLARLKLADLFLDTLPYNAHTSAVDALWAGLPVITCRGTTFAGRVAASLLTAAGMPELVTNSLDEYEALALALAREPAKLAAIKAKLAGGRTTTPLFDAARFTRNLEKAYSEMWRRSQQGEAPAPLVVEDE